MVTFPNRVLFVGFGAVARCTLPILIQHLSIDPKRITIIDFDQNDDALKPWIEQGMTYIKDRVTPENLGSLLGKHVSVGDLLIDLAWNIDACEILQWCHDRGVLYVNTSVEVWDPYAGAENKHPTERTLHWRHVRLRRMIETWSEPGPTAVVEHGANPGLISHFTKQALLDIAERALADGKFSETESETIAHHAKAQNFNHLAHHLGVKVIHCSERDTQITDQPKQVDEFVNTWSVEGFREEGTTTAEMGWGTHEKELPAYAYEHPDGPKSQICLARMGINTYVSTWVPPDHKVVGMIVRHGEAFTITEKLTVWEDGKAIYRPTVHYAYCPCDSRDCLASRTARLRLPTAIPRSHHDRRNHARRRHSGSSRDGASLQFVVVRNRSRNRRVAPPGAAPERDHHAGRHVGGCRLHVDDREPAPWGVRSRRFAPRIRARREQTLLGQVCLGGFRLDPSEALFKRLQRI